MADVRGEARIAFDALLERADAVTLHVPLTRATRHIIDATALARMKRGAMLINCARGPVVDEAALVEALRSGHLGGAGLDVYEIEPLPAGSPLADFPNVVMTPHTAAGTRDAMRQKMAEIFANIERFSRGEPLADRVDLSAEI
jgi:phosphoglycerate dehydrogenase-like enzyme